MIQITNLGTHLTATQKRHLAKMIEMNLMQAKVNTFTYSFNEVEQGIYHGFYIQNRYRESKGKVMPEKTNIKFSAKTTKS